MNNLAETEQERENRKNKNLIVGLIVLNIIPVYAVILGTAFGSYNFLVALCVVPISIVYNLIELACFACGKFCYSENLFFRILAVSYDFAMMVTYAVFAVWSHYSSERACTITMSVFYAFSVCIGVYICICYSEMKKHYGTNQSPTNVMTTNQVTTVQMANPQTVQTVMINGQLMQVVTPANQIATQPTIVTTGNIAGNQPQMLIVQNPNNQQVVQAAVQPSIQPVAQAVVQPAPIIAGQNDLPPAYQV